ncbi:hypothetical protein LP419_35000 [Massilia sp. H-1]|nr:hypothetical protein LP419_35000 [Massilia sp. H-1]
MLSLGQPLTPLQLLWLNLLSDVLLSHRTGRRRPGTGRHAAPAARSRTADCRVRGHVALCARGRRPGMGALSAYAYGVLRYGPGAR